MGYISARFSSVSRSIESGNIYAFDLRRMTAKEEVSLVLIDLMAKRVFYKSLKYLRSEIKTSRSLMINILD
jgi:hypothetical protein